jgi:hypothetical protein
MDNLVKKSSTIIMLIFMLFLSSCTSNQQVERKEIINTVEQLMESIVDEDAESVFDFFASDIRNNRKELTIEEIQQAFAYIDGNIISYDAIEICGEEEHKENGQISFFHCLPEACNVTTDTGYKYTIRFTYGYIWAEKPEREGVWKICIINENDSDSNIVVGLTYHPDE